MQLGHDSRFRLAVLLALAVALGLLSVLAGCKKGPEAATGEAVTESAGAGAAGAALEEGDDMAALDRGVGAGGGAGAAARGPGAGGGGGARGGGRGGRGGMARGGMAGGGMAGEAAPGAVAGDETGGTMGVAVLAAIPETVDEVKVTTKSAAEGIPEVEKMKKIRDFAAVYGATTLIKAEGSDGSPFEWVSVTPEEGKAKGQQVVMPISMVMDAPYPEVLEGYFPIYALGSRSLGTVASRETITESRRPRRDPREIAAEQRKMRAAAATAAAAAAAEAAEAAGAGAAGMGGAAGGMRGGGMGGAGGRGRGGMRGRGRM